MKMSVGPKVPTAGFEALGAYIERMTPHVQTLQHKDLLLLRSAVALRVRLEFFLDSDDDMSAGLLSPLDVSVIEELAAANPELAGALTELQHAIEQCFNPKARR